MSNIIVILIILFTIGCQKNKAEQLNKPASSILSMAPHEKISDSIYLHQFKGWLFSIKDLSSSESIGCCLIVIDSNNQSIMIPTLRYAISDYTIENFNVCFDYNFKELEAYINNSNYINNHISEYEQDFQIIFNRYVNIMNHTHATDSLFGLESKHMDSVRSDINVLESGFDCFKFNYNHELIIVYYQKSEINFSIAGLTYKKYISIKHYGETSPFIPKAE